MRLAPALAVIALLAACDEIPDKAPAKTPLQPPTPKAAARPDPADLFFVGRWAARPDLCDEGAWVITTQALNTAGEVSCKVADLKKTAGGYEVPATCWAEGPPQQHRLRFARAPSPGALLVSNGPFADMELLRCPGGAWPAAEPAEAGTPGGLPDDGTPIAEGPIGPSSAQRAGQVLQTYFAHLSERQYQPAWALWRDGGRASGLDAEAFARSFAGYDSLAAEIGAPAAVEAAAGSLYVRIPVQVYGRLKDGTVVRKLGQATLRRANDVPGATAAERAWRIQSIEYGPAATAAPTPR